MKTSNILLLCLIALFLVSMVTTDLSLKAAYDKLDKNDRFIGYTSTRIQPATYVRLHGMLSRQMSVETGAEPLLYIQALDKEKISYKQTGDTLDVYYAPTGREDAYYVRFGATGYQIDQPPVICIVLPILAHLTTEGVNTRLLNLKQDSISVAIRGPRHGLLVVNSSLARIRIDAQQGSGVQIAPNNTIGQASIILSDSAQFWAERDNIGVVTIQASNLASIRVPGSMVKKLR